MKLSDKANCSGLESVPYRGRLVMKKPFGGLRTTHNFKQHYCKTVGEARHLWHYADTCAYNLARASLACFIFGFSSKAISRHILALSLAAPLMNTRPIL